MKQIDKLDKVRARIDEIDDRLLRLLKDRFDLVEEVISIKQAGGMDVVQPARFQELLDNLKEKAVELGVSPQAVESIWHAIHETSIKHQEATKADL